MLRGTSLRDKVCFPQRTPRASGASRCARHRTSSSSLRRCCLEPNGCSGHWSNVHAAAGAPRSPTPRHPAPHHLRKSRERPPCSVLHRDTHPGRQRRVLQGAVHICSEALSQRPREEQVPRDEHPKYRKIKTAVRGVKPLRKERPRFAGKSTGTEVPRVEVLQWKPGAGWHWVTRNY